MLVKFPARFVDGLMRATTRRRRTHDLFDANLGSMSVISHHAATHVAFGDDADQLEVCGVRNHRRAAAARFAYRAGETVVAAMAPLAVLGVVGDNPALHAVAVEADARLRRALQSIRDAGACHMDDMMTQLHGTYAGMNSCGGLFRSRPDVDGAPVSRGQRPSADAILKMIGGKIIICSIGNRPRPAIIGSRGIQEV